ncbi:MAG: sugar transporter substrate-binding protein [Acidimicrobiaceae bacterium]|nr:sugar transporter substrate-binding protein [Acidimicrobiaceae bacterium]
MTHQSDRTLRAHDRLKRYALLAGTAGMVAGVAGTAAATTRHATPVTVRVAVVANPDMQAIEKLTPTFEKQNPGIKVVYDTLNENTERQLIETDITTHANEFNAVMISNYETPIWAKNGWLSNLSSFTKTDPAYDVNDLIGPIRDSLSYKGSLYSVPFYGESSMLYYRKDLLAKAGITMPLHPTWAQVASAAQKVNTSSTAGICLRGLSGWGENLAALDTVINTYGGSWFNMKWTPQLTSKPDVAATNFYVNLVKNYGEPGASNDGFTECLNAYSQGKAAMWYDATVAAGSIAAANPTVFANTGYAYAPVGPAKIPSGWLYTWSLSIPAGTPNQQATWKYLSWATGKQSILLSGQKLGWAQIPPGSRVSTYQIPQYKKAAAAFAGITLASIQAARPTRPTLHPVPYVGVQFVDIPQFINLGTQVSQQISAAIAGRETVAQALATGQQDATTTVKQSGL